MYKRYQEDVGIKKYATDPQCKPTRNENGMIDHACIPIQWLYIMESHSTPAFLAFDV